MNAASLLLCVLQLLLQRHHRWSRCRLLLHQRLQQPSLLRSRARRQNQTPVDHGQLDGPKRGMHHLQAAHETSRWQTSIHHPRKPPL